MKKFYALALLTLALSAHARSQQTNAPATRPRRVQPAHDEPTTQPTPQTAMQQTPTAPRTTTRQTPAVASQPDVQSAVQSATPAQTPAASATPTPVPADAHDYAPIRERELSYKNWTFKPPEKGEALNLREWARGKRLVLVAYFAPWCRNSKLEAPVVAELYNKYHARGFDVVAVAEYGTADEWKTFLAEHPLPFPLVVESTSQDSRAKTTHYAYRQQSGDTRKWGTPFNVFIDPSTLAGRGDVLSQKVWAANGELVPAEAEQFIRERLGLPSVAAAKD